jgi:hypothetical protein
MTEIDWYTRRNDRQRRYAGRVLPADRPIVISLDPSYGARFDGQVAAIVAVNLLARMTPSLVLDVPHIQIVSPLPWAGAVLSDFMLRVARGADPYGVFTTRLPTRGDYVLSFGRGDASAAVHGSGWYAFVGSGHSPIPDADVPNPIGPSFAAVAAAARLFARELAPIDGPFLFDAFNWRNAINGSSPPLAVESDLGKIWTVGAGSVGTAALYFLALATRRFSALVIDMDKVKVENLDRSPIFTSDDAAQDLYKADVTASYLRAVGVIDAAAECTPLDASLRWSKRTEGMPDLIISAANERNVRYVIERSCPPLQIYGTTGANWVASVIRHIPFVDGCSCCIFPHDLSRPAMACAEAQIEDAQSGEQIDASLPFLSFAAGLMAAAEVLKAGLCSYPFSAGRTTFCTGPMVLPRFVSSTPPRRPGCICGDRSESVHRRMIAGTRYAHLSSIPIHMTSAEHQV